MSIDWGGFYGKDTNIKQKKKKGDHWWDGWFSEDKEIKLSEMQNWIFQTINSYSVNQYKNCGITEGSILRMCWESHFYNNSDVSEKDAKRSIRRAINELVSKGFIEKRKWGDKVVLLSTKKGQNWLYRFWK